MTPTTYLEAWSPGTSLHHFTSARVTERKPSDEYLQDPLGLNFIALMKRNAPGWRKRLDLKHIPYRQWLSV